MIQLTMVYLYIEHYEESFYHESENAHYYELLYYLQQLKNEPLQKTQ